MLLKLFKSNHPSVIFLIPILAVVFWIPSLFELPIEFSKVDIANTTYIYNWVLNLFNFYPKGSVIFALILLVIQSYILIRLNFKYIFLENKTYLPSVFFIVFASIFSIYQSLHPLLIGNLFFLLALDKALLFEKSKNHIKRYFESGFYIGLGAIFYPNIYILLSIVWLTMFLLRSFNWREWFASVLGAFTPFLFYISFLFLTDNFHQAYINIMQILNSSASTPSLSDYSNIALAFVGFILFIAIIGSARVVGLRKISTRKYFSLFFWSVVLIISLYFLHPSVGFELSIVLAVPISIICSMFFTEMKSKWLSEVLFGLTLLSVFVIIWFQ